MASSSNCSGGIIAVVCPPAECPDTPQIDLTSINLTGIAILDSWNGTQGDFRGVASANSMLTVTLDAGNHTALFSISIADIATAFPQATETVRGSAEIATAAETTTGTSDTTIVSPLKLQQKLDALDPNRTFDSFSIATEVPGFNGQFAGLTDAPQGLVSFGTNAGEWAQMLTEGGYNQWGVATTLTLNAAPLTINGFSNSAVTFTGLTSFNLASPLNFAVGSSLKIGGTSLAAKTMLGSVLGSAPAEILISDFLSAYNLQVYGAPTGTLTRTAFVSYPGQAIFDPPTQAQVQAMDTALQEVSQHLAALITDMQNNLKPGL